MKYSFQVMPAEHGYILSGTISERSHGFVVKHPLTGDVDDDGLVTAFRWVREAGVEDAHADVMMSKDQSSFVAVMYDRSNIPHQFSFHRTK